MTRPRSDKLPPKPDIYMVIFYDQLGTSDQYSTWDSPEAWSPDNQTGSTGFFDYCKLIYDIRTAFKSVSDGVNDADVGSELDKYRDQIDKKALDEIDKLRLGTIRRQSFSDTNIWFLQTADDEIDGKCYCRAMNGMLTGLSYCHLQAIAKGQFGRAGVDLGYGTDLGDYSDGEELHGPVLLSAYRLEGNAGWARLVVGDGLVHALDHRIQQLAAEKQNASTKSEWVICFYEHHFLSDMRSMIIQYDKAYMVDFAGKVAAKDFVAVMLKNKINPFDFYTKLLAEVKTQVQKHRDIGNDKHLQRAIILQQYLQSRKKYWVE